MATITNSICTSSKQINILSGASTTQIGSNTSVASVRIFGYGGSDSNVQDVIIGQNSINGLGSTEIYGSNSGLFLQTSNNGSIGMNTDGTGTINIASGSGGLLINNSGTRSTTVIGSSGDGSGVYINSDYSTNLSASIATNPVSSNAATIAFGTSLTAGTSLQNNNGYNLLVNICVKITTATSATITLGVDSITTPTVNTVVSSFTTATGLVQNFSAIVPAYYYLLVNTTGTITISSITVQSCPM